MTDSTILKPTLKQYIEWICYFYSIFFSNYLIIIVYLFFILEKKIYNNCIKSILSTELNTINWNVNNN